MDVFELIGIIIFAIWLIYLFIECIIDIVKGDEDEGDIDG